MASVQIMVGSANGPVHENPLSYPMRIARPKGTSRDKTSQDEDMTPFSHTLSIDSFFPTSFHQTSQQDAFR